MSQSLLNYGVKSYDFFFDRDAVLSRLSKKEAKVLSRTGLRGRDEIRRRVKPGRKKQENDGIYPTYHTHKNAGLRFVLFVVHPIRASVLIGPQKFSTEVYGQPLVSSTITGGGRDERGRFLKETSTKHVIGWLEKAPSKPVPQLINEGGESQFTYRYKSGKTYVRRVKYRAFPFVTDAEKPTLERMKQLLRDIPL